MVKEGKEFWTKSTVVGLGLGQLLSLLVTFTGFTSSQLAKQGISAPFSQCLFSYVLLALVYGGIMLHRGQPPKAQPYIHSMLAAVDILAKYFAIKAYQFTSLTSVMLLDCWTIPCVVALTWLFLNTKYGPTKLVGIVICVLGLVAVVLSDLQSAPDRLSIVKYLVGNLLIIFGATLYGVGSVCEEIYLKEADRVEIMAFLGLFGALITVPQIVLYERSEFKSIFSSHEMRSLFIGFYFAMFLFYSGVPFLLKITGSTMLNLSLLTSNIWAVLIRIFAYHEKVNLVYFAGFAAVTLGLFVYSGRDEMDSNNGEAVNIDEEALLVHSVNDGISNSDGSRFSFQGVRNSLLYILHD